jgi:hypothetical protein
MATRFHYAVPILRQFLISRARRLRRGGLPASLPTSSQDRPLVIVSGAGRSGTSAVARVLHESGVLMGRELGEPSDANPDGFYEDMDVWWLHERLLTELGMSNFWRPGRWPWRSTVLAMASGYREEMRALIAGATDGWKDPRFAVILEAWLALLPARPKVVVCLRSPQAHTASVSRLYGLVDREMVDRQWARHYRRLLDVIRDYELEATCVEYDALVEHPEPVVADLAEFVGRPLRAEYVNPPLRRFRHPVPKRYLRLYHEVLALGGSSAALAASAPDAGGAPPAHASGRAAALGDAGVQEVDAYVQRVNDIDVRVQAAKAGWNMHIGLPRPTLDRFQQMGLTLPEAMERTRATSDEYAAVVNEAQEELEALEPPPCFERYHELIQRGVDLERMVVELMRSAAQGEAPDRRMLKTAVRAWRLFGRGAAIDKALERRQREYVKALEASGYLAARRAAEPN